jgi:DNA-binding transcriptional ArsR family regulator
MSRARSSQRPTRVARDATPRRLTDPREMRALAHPVRVALLEILTREGPLTATEASELLGESPANCSFHLRTLAKYGFVEEAEGGTGRARPWRRVALGQSFSEAQPDPETSVAAQTLADISHARTFERLREFSRNHSRFSADWNDAAFSNDILLYLTADELKEMGEEMVRILMRHHDRTLDIGKRPSDARPVHIATFGTPLSPTPSGY